MVIDREYWGFVVALITNMESSALGSFLCFSTSLHPLVLYCTLRPSSRCLISRVRNNIFFCCFFFLFLILLFDFSISLMLFSFLFSSPEQVEDWGIKKRGRERRSNEEFIVGGFLIIERLTD